ncbi:MAG: hypothetical protein R8G66_27420 [Cytophagales bacterium]|nr:hypothetical protein [Cytophagales bacterium]
MEDTVKLNFQALLFDDPWSIWILTWMKVVISIANFEKVSLTQSMLRPSNAVVIRLAF